MDNPSIVVALADSPALRETLAVLLEHDCQLRFLPPDNLVIAAATGAPDLLLVATAGRARALDALADRWPALPIVAIALPEARAAVPPKRPGVQTVPLEPQAIRDAVLEHLEMQPDSGRRATVQLVAETLQTELHYAFIALRRFSALHATGAGPDTYAVLAAVMREQSHVIAEHVDHMQCFQHRPRDPETSPHFAVALCHELEQPDALAAHRGLLCTCTVDAAPSTAGPLSLVPTLASLLRAHLHRRSRSPVIAVRATHDGVTLRYAPRGASRSPHGSWPLLLASCALQPWTWQVSVTGGDREETVRLCPTFQAEWSRGGA